MSTRDEIIHLTDRLIRDKGFNGFSFHDLSKKIGIKTASIHYHFPTKGDLGVATIKEQWKSLDALKDSLANKSPWQKLNGFFSIYEKAKSEKMVCLVGSLATDLNTVDQKVKVELTNLADAILIWLTETLDEGKSGGAFHFNVPARTKALMIITNMLGIVQLMRLTGQEDFEAVKKSIIKELKSR
jgi:AcrR family transcriptional regulator